MADICFTYIPTGRTVVFKDIVINSFADQLNTELDQEKTFGRMDPIITFQGTSRTIALSFSANPIKKTNSDIQMVSKYNFRALGELMKLQYPTYESTNISNALAIKSPPVFKVRLNNYIQDNGEPLMCFMEGVGFSIDDGASKQAMPTMVGGAFIPRTFTVSITLHVLHRRPVGWNKGKWQGGQHWPFFNDTLVKETGGNTASEIFVDDFEDVPVVGADRLATETTDSAEEG